MADLLLECFSEEIPARMQKGGVEQLQKLVCERLDAARLSYDHVKPFVSPRHLAILVSGLPAQQPDQTIERKGPRTSAPEKALEGFLKSTGLSIDDLHVRGEGKDATYFAVSEEKGKPSADALKPLLEDALAQFVWPKSMRWGAHELTWVRPLHSIICLLDTLVLPINFGHITAGNTTYGHRFHGPQQITIEKPADYEAALEEAYVLVDATKRKAKIREQVIAAAKSEGVEWHEDEGLLQEVTGLVEWPTTLLGPIEEEFMALPPEVLVSEMREHQKYFAFEKSGNVTPHFATVSNLMAQDEGKAILHGNGRVLRARLSDGQFFWDTDRKRPLSEWATDLSGVVFHAKLGSIADKVDRITSLSALLAMFVPHADMKKVERAAQLCKADLVTGMVGEFPDLQGVMGRYYAIEQGEDEAVADAIRDHYKPQGANDSVPEGAVTITVALADKLDSLVGLFAIGEKPTGSKDPFALRRAALGIISIMLAHKIRLSIPLMVDKALSLIPKAKRAADDAEIAKDLVRFFGERLKVALKEQGVAHDVIAATYNDGAEDDMVRLVAKAEAMQAFIASEDGKNLLAAYKRASNILKAEEKKDQRRFDGKPQAAHFTLEQEQELASALDAVQKPIVAALKQEDFTAAMSELATLRAPLDAYFETVMVNDDAAAVRENRLFTLHQIRASFETIAAFEHIEK